MEPIIGAAFEMTPVRTSRGPEILLFKRFKHKYQFVDLDNFRAARKAVETLVDQFYSHILEFAKKYLELEEPRDDYRGFLELSAFISQRCSWSCNSNASLHASSTLDCQSYLRDKDALFPWLIQIDNARTKCYSLYSLSVLIHLREPGCQLSFLLWSPLMTLGLPYDKSSHLPTCSYFSCYKQEAWPSLTCIVFF